MMLKILILRCFQQIRTGIVRIGKHADKILTKR